MTSYKQSYMMHKLEKLERHKTNRHHAPRSMSCSGRMSWSNWFYISVARRKSLARKYKYGEGKLYPKGSYDPVACTLQIIEAPTPLEQLMEQTKDWMEKL